MHRKKNTQLTNQNHY